MTDRATIESILKDAYAARLRGDVEGMVRHFADDAVFALAGAREASPVALRCSACDSMRASSAPSSSGATRSSPSSSKATEPSRTPA